MTTNYQELEKQIDDVVQQFLSQTQRVASVAVQRAFAGSARERRATLVRVKSPASGIARRRTVEEIEALGERLYKVVCSHPGATMTQMASELGATIKEMQVPVARLKRAGRLRTVGLRHMCRYFPMIDGTASS